MVCVTPEHTWARQLHQRNHGGQLFSRQWVWRRKMPNALGEPAELRGHLITARCGEGAPRTSPSHGENTRPAAQPPASGMETRPPRGGKRTPGSGERRRAESGLERRMMPPTLLGIFFQLKSWELESVNNDFGLQTNSKRHDGTGNTLRSQAPAPEVEAPPVCTQDPGARSSPARTPRKVRAGRTFTPSSASPARPASPPPPYLSW